MNPGPEPQNPPTGRIPAMEHVGGNPQPANWREALMILVASRVALVQLESRDAAKAALRRAACIAAMAACCLFAWALLLAGGISALADATEWQWHWIAIGTAILHLIAAIWLAKSAQSPGTPAFPVTRAEFQKDREWIENLQKPRKSND